MNKNFPKSMIVVAAVVSFGMIGSQLDLGGLSGQAAGGEAAGCGGDAYYDEDLGALVDSEGNVVDENGESSATAESGEETPLFEGVQGFAFGEAMQGQNLVTIMQPDPEYVSLLEEIGEEGQDFQAHVDVSPDGNYAVIVFGVEGESELTHVRVLENTPSGYIAYPVLNAERGVGLPVEAVQIIQADEESLLFRVGPLNHFRFEWDSGAIFYTPKMVVAQQVMDRAEESGDAQLFQLNRVNLQITQQIVAERVPHTWLESFVLQHFDGVDYTMTTAISSEVFVALDGGTVLAISACDLGAAPLNAGGELVCRSCEEIGGCDNVLNRVDMLDLGLEARYEARVESFQMLREQGTLRPVNLERIQAAIGEKATTNATRATMAYHHSKPDGATDRYVNGNLVMDRYGNCTFAFRGSDDGSDWWSNLLGVFTGSVNVNGQDVHRGFKNEFYKAKDELDKFVPNCENPKFIGHSLGGAIASVARQHYGKGKVISYGAPKSHRHMQCGFPGNRTFHDGDPVAGNLFGALGRFKHSSNNAKKLYHKCVRHEQACAWGVCVNLWCNKHEIRETSASCGEGSGTFDININNHSMRNVYKPHSSH